MSEKIDVSIIIVNYNTRELTRNCLSSIYKQTKGISFEVILSDNGSTDGSIEMIHSQFPHVILIENNANLGFGKANNRGLDIARGKYIFYLNSDTVLLNNAVKIFFDYWENNTDKQLGGLGAVLLDENMNTIHSGGRFPTYKQICLLQMYYIAFHIIKSLISIFHLKWFYEKKQRMIPLKVEVKTGEIDGYITGADIFLRNNKDAYFDENYFMYFEESDLQFQLKKKGFRFFILEEPMIQHLTRRIGGKNFVIRTTEIFSQDSSVYYSQKNFGHKAWFLRFLIFFDRLNPLVRKVVKQTQ